MATLAFHLADRTVQREKDHSLPFDRLGPGCVLTLEAWLNNPTWVRVESQYGFQGFDGLLWIWSCANPRTLGVDYFLATGRQMWRYCKYHKIDPATVLPVPEESIHGTCVREDSYKFDGVDETKWASYRLVQARTLHPWTWEPHPRNE